MKNNKKIGFVNVSRQLELMYPEHKLIIENETDMLQGFIIHKPAYTMQVYNCIIVEDEPLAAEVLQDYIAQVPFLKLEAVCTDAIFAMEILAQEKDRPHLSRHPSSQTEGA
jgi:hypothetical protein